MEGETTIDVNDDVIEEQDVKVDSDNKEEVDNPAAEAAVHEELEDVEEEGIATTTTNINNTDDSSTTNISEESDQQTVKNNGVNETEVTVVSVEGDDMPTAAEEEGQHDKENSAIHEDAADNYEDAEQAGKSSNNHLPLSKIKHIMKLDPDVTLCSSDAAFLITRATVSSNMHPTSRHYSYIMMFSFQSEYL